MQFNPKGTFFWSFLAGANICASFQFGPAVGMGGFLGLAVAVWLLG